MDLKNGNITIGELLNNPSAKALLAQEFPGMMRHPMMHMAGKITLNTAVGLAGDALPVAKRKEIIAKLKEI